MMPGSSKATCLLMTLVSWTARVAVALQRPEWTATSRPPLIPATRALMVNTTVRPSSTVAVWRLSTRRLTAGRWVAVIWCVARSTSFDAARSGHGAPGGGDDLTVFLPPRYQEKPIGSAFSRPSAAPVVSRTAAVRSAVGARLQIHAPESGRAVYHIFVRYTIYWAQISLAFRFGK